MKYLLRLLLSLPKLITIAIAALLSLLPLRSILVTRALLLTRLVLIVVIPTLPLGLDVPTLELGELSFDGVLVRIGDLIFGLSGC